MKDERNDERNDERPESSEERATKRDLRFGDAFGTQRDRSTSEEGGYLDPEFGSREHGGARQNEAAGNEEDSASDASEPPERRAGERDLKYGNAFGTQRDRSSSEEGSYLEPEFGSREQVRPIDSDDPEGREEDTEE